MLGYVINMLTDDPFNDVPVLGALDVRSAASYLAQVGEGEIATQLEEAQAEQSRQSRQGSRSGIRWPFSNKPWQYTSHAFGYIRSGALDREAPIVSAGTISADDSLRNAAIDITLDRLRVADYPGGSTHHVLLDFYAQNRADDRSEHLHYNMFLRALEGQEAAVIGYPIFVRLNVGGSGVGLRCLTVNVKNESDEKFLSFLGSDVFRTGLHLATAVQPALVPFSEMVLALTKAIAQRNRNVPVQEFFLGLDFSEVPTRARLAEGSYVIVQVPDGLVRVWDWDEWIYDGRSGHIVSRQDSRDLIPFNYVVIGVSRARRPDE